MRDILFQSNLNLLHDIKRIKSILSSSNVIEELSDYCQYIIFLFDSLQSSVEQNLNDLELNIDDIHDDILSKLQQITQKYQIYDQYLISPILRSLQSDRLCLKLLRWLHMIHDKTKYVPVAFSDGEIGIWPVFPIYFMPPSAQHGLLYLPLFFHEFGHLLYTCHKQETKDLINDLQDAIDKLLKPAFQRNDRYSQGEAKKRKIIVETWYTWAQEIFCDAVGLVIGGPCYAKAYSMFTRTKSREEFHSSSDKLAFKSHPISWLRIRLIADRARKLNLNSEATILDKEWTSIANILKIDEDYYGYYEDQYLPVIQQTIDDMLEETSPYNFTDKDISLSNWNTLTSSPVHLLNIAWNKFFK